MMARVIIKSLLIKIRLFLIIYVKDLSNALLYLITMLDSLIKKNIYKISKPLLLSK